MGNLLDDFEDLPEINERSSWFDMARKMMLAGVGAVVLAQEEIECFVGKLVERGELAEKEGKQLVYDMKAWRFSAKTKPDTPSVADFEALQAKIDLLSVQVDQLLGGE
jgi:polyhydroxyalkanoate synthesis regulator phasin